jgi:large subunit ribosomal protein L18
MSKTTSKTPRQRRHVRIRQKIAGTTGRPRLVVFRSLTHIYAAIVDDSTGNTLLAASTVEKELHPEAKGKRKTEKAGLIGARLAGRAIEKGISQVVFDRGGYQYHGRVKALAEAARKAGLKF